MDHRSSAIGRTDDHDPRAPRVSKGRNSTFEFSIVVATRNRAHRLARCLDAIEGIAFPRAFEVLIVDNGSNDATPELIARFAGGSRHRAWHLHEPRRGASRALNLALRHAGGEYLLFTDDDCYPDPDILVALAAAFADRRVGFVAGRVRLFDPDDIPLAVRDTPDRESFRPGAFIRPGDVHGANLAFRRRALLEIGGFDVSFGPGALYSGADVEACARASAAGWLGVYDPRPLVLHHHGRKPPELRAQRDRYNFGAGAYLAKTLVRTPGAVRHVPRALHHIAAASRQQGTMRIIAGFADFLYRSVSGRLER